MNFWSNDIIFVMHIKFICELKKHDILVCNIKIHWNSPITKKEF
jgi:hypothetical protein